MSLTVSIKKNLENCLLDVSFETSGNLALLGASGSGKSMTLKCIAGIETPDSGYIVLNGRVLFDSEKHINLRPQERKVGYLFQQYALFPNMTVRQNIGVGIHKLNKKEREERTQDLMRMFRLEDHADQYPSTLSGGEQQRTALARILATEPDILLLDEPFSALDNYLKKSIARELLEELKRFHCEYVFVSHSFDEVYRVCDSVIVLNNGVSRKKTSKEDLMKHPKDVNTAGLIGCENILECRKAGKQSVFFSTEEFHTEETVQDRIKAVCFFSRDVVLYKKEQGENVMKCVLKGIEHNPFSVSLELECPDKKTIIRAEMQDYDYNKLKVGSHYFIHLPADKLMLITE